MQSTKFKFVSKAMNQMMNQVLRNRAVRRYITYIGKQHPLDAGIPDISPAKVFEENVYFKIYTEEVLSDEKVVLFLNPIEQDYENISLGLDFYQLDIVVPESAWEIVEGMHREIRAYSILHEIAKEIDQQKITGIGEVTIQRSFMQSMTKGYTIVSTVIMVNTSMRA